MSSKRTLIFLLVESVFVFGLDAFGEPRPKYIPPTYLNINISDEPEAPLSNHLQKCFDFIDKARQANGRVLVHCVAGVSRSGAVVVGYSMKEQGLSYERALAFVRKSRSSVCPNEGFKAQLENFDFQRQN
ncbi:protein-tyrosine phosphatase-like protein [Endogone sp. FLAS-F59071]|nr:protein-tyrosine phosphatase-like protein [Endogone sp. FLAS-F59071]|eukprot:RUS23256.1 protein-tyrosine phosphatase-like protein [Endogone sp. FLAS-F59071]